MEIFNPEDLAQEGQAAYQRGDHRAAADLFKQAEGAYQQQGNDLMAAEMANNQSVAWLKAGEPQASLDAVGDTPALFALQGDGLREAMAIGNRAAALDTLGRLEEAEADYLRCADMLKDLGEADLRANVMQSISTLQMRTGRQMEALASMQAGVSGLEKLSLRQRILKKLLQIPQKFLTLS